PGASPAPGLAQRLPAPAALRPSSPVPPLLAGRHHRSPALVFAELAAAAAEWSALVFLPLARGAPRPGRLGVLAAPALAWATVHRRAGGVPCPWILLLLLRSERSACRIFAAGHSPAGARGQPVPRRSLARREHLPRRQ